MLEWLNGYTPQVCKYHDTTDVAKKCIYNEVEPSGKFKRYTNGDDLVKLHYMRINELTGTDYKKSFNFFSISAFVYICLYENRQKSSTFAALFYIWDRFMLCKVKY